MRTATRRNAFTLIELLVVIGIIGILVALAFAVGHHVSGAGKAHATLSTIQTLEGSLDAYISEKGSMPPPTVLDPRPNGGNPNNVYVWPVADVRHMTGAGQEMVNSVGLYILQGKGLPAVEGAIRGVDQKFMRTYDPDGTGVGFSSQPELVTAFDAWDNPIRYVHPTFHGIVGTGGGNPPTQVQLATFHPVSAPRQYADLAMEIRRGTAGPADGDGGMCTGGRPYFYSCGPDGDPGSVGDNVYHVKPQIQKTH